MSTIQKDGWAKKARRLKEDRIWALILEEIDGRKANNAEDSDALASDGDEKEVAGEVVDRGNDPSNDTKHDAVNNNNDTSTETGNDTSTEADKDTSTEADNYTSEKAHNDTDAEVEDDTGAEVNNDTGGEANNDTDAEAHDDASAEANNDTSAEDPPADVPQPAPSKPSKLPIKVHCWACDITTLQASVAKHKQTKSHLRYVEAHQNPSAAPGFDPKKDVYCKLCLHSYDRYGYEMHLLKSKEHQRREAALVNPPPGFFPVLPPLRKKGWTLEQDEIILSMWFDLKDERDMLEKLPGKVLSGVENRRRYLMNGATEPELKALRTKIENEYIDRGREPRQAKEDRKL